jgi:WD40 repeat protein
MGYDAFISYSHSADGRLAPALQTGLQRFARPWYRRHAVRVFRDETGLSVNPHLWASIQTALDNSRYFVLLASPDAAASPWVQREINHWLATKPSSTFLPVLTDGTLVWDEKQGDFDPSASSALPDSLRGVFDDEPRHLDLRWARDETELDLRNSRFRSQVAEIAAPLHGKAKDELEGEDIRLHRRALRLAWGGAAALVALTAFALVAAFFATSYAATARQQRSAALASAKSAKFERGRALTNAKRAQTNATRANEQTVRAVAATKVSVQKGKEALANGRRAERNAAEALRNAGEAQRNAAEARRNADEAQRNAAQAQTNADEAQTNADLASQSAEEAQANADRATVLAGGLKNANGQLVATNHSLHETLDQRDAALVAKNNQRLAGIARGLVNASRSALQDGQIDRGVLLAAAATRFAHQSHGVISESDVQQPLVDALETDSPTVTWLRGLDGAILDVDVSPDGTRAAAVSDHNQIGVWSLSNFHQLAKFPAPPRAEFVGFIDADTVVVAAHQRLEMYQTSSAGTSWTRAWAVALSGEDHIRALAVARSGAIAISLPATNQGEPNRVQVFDRAGASTGPIEVPSSANLVHLAVTASGSHFAITDNQTQVGGPSVVRVYTADGWPVSVLGTSGANQGFVTDLRFSGDGTNLGVLTSDLLLHRFDLNAQTEQVSSVPAPPGSSLDRPIAIGPRLDRVVQRYNSENRRGAAENVIGVGFLAPAPAPGRFAGDLDAPLAVRGPYDVPTQGPRQAAFRSDGRLILTAGGDGAIPVFLSPDLARSRIVAARTATKVGEDTQAALARDGSLLVAVNSTNTGVSTMHVAGVRPSGRQVDVLLPRAVDNVLALGLLQRPVASHSIAFGNSRTVVAVAYLDGSIDIRSTSDGAVVMHLAAAHPCDPTIANGTIGKNDCALYLPDISFSGTMSDGYIAQAFLQHVHIWRLRDNAVVSQSDIANMGDGTQALLAASGRRLVTIGFADARVSVFDRAGAGWAKRRAFMLPATASGAAVSSDGGRLAVTDGSRVALYDVDLGTRRWARTSLEQKVWFSAGGGTLYTASRASVTIRSTRGGSTRSTFELPGSAGLDAMPLDAVGNSARVTFASGVFAQGQSADAEMAIRVGVRALLTSELVDAACRAANRNLTRAEWSQYVGDADAYEATCARLP